MLSKKPFYYSTTRKVIVAFAGLFSSVFCVTKDKAGTTKKIVNVPIALANKEKFVVRLQQDPTLANDVEISLPRLSFEIVGIDYDSVRQLNKMNKVISEKDGRTVYSYSPVPYLLTINLYSYTRTQEDNYQIMEQILPYFTPDMNVSIKMMQNPDVIQDCQLILNSVNTDDSYDGSFEERRYIITTYAFTMKISYFGPMHGIGDVEGHFDVDNAASVIKQVNVNINNLKYTAVVDPFEANSGDIYSVPESWSDIDPPNIISL